MASKQWPLLERSVVGHLIRAIGMNEMIVEEVDDSSVDVVVCTEPQKLFSNKLKLESYLHKSRIKLRSKVVYISLNFKLLKRRLSAYHLF